MCTVWERHTDLTRVPRTPRSTLGTPHHRVPCTCTHPYREVLRGYPLKYARATYHFGTLHSEGSSLSFSKRFRMSSRMRASLCSCPPGHAHAASSRGPSYPLLPHAFPRGNLNVSAPTSLRVRSCAGSTPRYCVISRATWISTRAQEGVILDAGGHGDRTCR